MLHIGTHKTATTSLQSMMAANAAHFAGRGLCYPSCCRSGDGHHNLAWELNSDERYRSSAGSLADLARELRVRQADAVLLSSEDFEYLYRKPHRLLQLRETLEVLGYGVEVVVALRQPSDYVESLYCELRKHGLEGLLDDFAAEALAGGGLTFRSWDFRLDYQRLVASFAGCFGPEAIHVLRYEESEFVGLLAGTVGELAGLDLTAVPGWPRLNQRQLPAGRGESAGTAPEPIRFSDRSRVSLTGVERRAIDEAFAGAIDVLCSRYPALPV